MLLRAWLRHAGERVFIWSDCLSYKPYLLAARNLRRIYPSPERPTPPDVQELLNALGARYYPGQYDRATGTVCKPASLLQPRVAPITADMRCDPFIAFHADRTPGHIHGDGLIAVYPGTFENLRHFLARRLRQALRP